MYKATPTHSQMRGLALPSVLVMLLLCAWLAVHAWRSLWLNELLLQARADALHTQNGADATLLAALDDVLQRSSNTPSTAASQRYQSGRDTDRHVFIPTTTAQLELLRFRLGNDDCREGLCAPMQPLSWLAADRQRRWSSGMPAVFDNTTTTPSTMRYWIEIFLQADAQDDTPAAPVWVYRITATASGLKSAAPQVLQAIWIATATTPETQANATAKASPTTGRWISWTVLHVPP